MKPFIAILALGAVLAGLRHASQRVATHQRVLPRPWSRINTQVHRINQRNR